jgi:hypothetical protein
MGWTLEDGRLFADDLADGCRVGVVNQEAAERYFGGKAVGAAVIDQAGRRTEIIGVVRSRPLRTLQRGIEPSIYFPMAQDFLRGMQFLDALPTTEYGGMIRSGIARLVAQLERGAGAVTSDGCRNGRGASARLLAFSPPVNPNAAPLSSSSAEGGARFTREADAPPIREGSIPELLNGKLLEGAIDGLCDVLLEIVTNLILHLGAIQQTTGIARYDV